MFVTMGIKYNQVNNKIYAPSSLSKILADLAAEHSHRRRGALALEAELDVAREVVLDGRQPGLVHLATNAVRGGVRCSIRSIALERQRAEPYGKYGRQTTPSFPVVLQHARTRTVERGEVRVALAVEGKSSPKRP
jgi:hypothetical protein